MAHEEVRVSVPAGSVSGQGAAAFLRRCMREYGWDTIKLAQIMNCTEADVWNLFARTDAERSGICGASGFRYVDLAQYMASVEIKAPSGTRETA